MTKKISWPTVAASIVTAVVAASATVATGAFGYLNADRSLDIEMVRISLSILSGENQDTSLNGRKFALRALARYSNIEIPKEEFDVWARTGTIPRIEQTKGLVPKLNFTDAFALELNTDPKTGRWNGIFAVSGKGEIITFEKPEAGDDGSPTDSLTPPPPKD